MMGQTVKPTGLTLTPLAVVQRICPTAAENPSVSRFDRRFHMRDHGSGIGSMMVARSKQLVNRHNGARQLGDVRALAAL